MALVRLVLVMFVFPSAKEEGSASSAMHVGDGTTQDNVGAGWRGARSRSSSGARRWAHRIISTRCILVLKSIVHLQQDSRTMHSVILYVAMLKAGAMEIDPMALLGQAYA